MHNIIKIICIVCFVLSGRLYAQDAPNIIFIVVDDLNDYINDYDALPAVSTPNIDRISSNGTVFTNAVCSAPLCCPSRTSFLTGKDPGYTHVYSSEDYKCNDFSKNFTLAGNNDTYFTIPGYLKDSANYFTYGINKIFHCYENFQEYDDETTDACSKALSWNKIFVYTDSAIINPTIIEEGVQNNEWSAINDTLEPYLMDYVAVDSSIRFIADFANGEGTCGNPFFLALGIKKPHKPLYIPEKYFAEEYVTDFYATPFDIPFNYPVNTFPANGLIMPPQPEIPFSDYYNLPTGGMGQQIIKDADGNFQEWAEDLSPMPIINPDFSDSLTIDILAWSKRANCVMAYLAAVNYIDAQIGRLLDSLESYPDVYNNTIIVFIGDNGFSLSEKSHWGKRAMWETDIRIPLLISDLRNPLANVSSSMVSLLDIFPTICGLANIPLPTFPDGTPYLDGHNISDLMVDENLMIERPQLSAVRKEADSEGSCFPQYSIRNDEFHLIRYQSNGGGPTECDTALSYIESELYEIGTQRTIDPNEWNNLVNNSNYFPVMQYLLQWLPDSILYLKPAYKLIIDDNFEKCLYDYDDYINLNFTTFDTLGIAISTPDSFIYQWTNSLSDDTLFTADAILPLNLINPIVFDTANHMFVYIQMIDTVHQAIIGFDMKQIKLNTDNEPTINFTSNMIDAFTIEISDVAITGSYESVIWDFGDGFTYEGLYPEPHTYDSIGSYALSCSVQFGNNDTCMVTAYRDISININNLTSSNTLIIYPNPSTTMVNIFIGEYMNGGVLTISDIAGKLVFESKLTANDYPLLTLPTTFLSEGVYFVKHETASSTQSGNFVILGNR